MAMQFEDIVNQMMTRISQRSTHVGEYMHAFLSLHQDNNEKDGLQRFRARVDNRRYNGAALLGLRGIVIKSHGSADAYAYGQALQRAREAVLNGLLEGTIQRLDALRGRTPSSAAGESAPTA